MTVAAVIVAAGRGTRMGAGVPKQYRRLGGQMILTRTIRAVLAARSVDLVRVAIGGDARESYRQAVAGIDDPRLLAPVTGGDSRATSVRAALVSLEANAPDRVLIHDAARPFVPAGLVEALAAAGDAAIPAEPVVDALWRGTDGHADVPVPRDGLWRAQTPQAFPFAAILAAHRARTDAPAALDDAEIFRCAGHPVTLVAGAPGNFKITTEADLARAERIVARETRMEYRTGQGFDVHRFRDGDGVWLCGVRVPHRRALEGHSDADVGLHALADAIYGALAEGDIGRHFPPSDPRWRGAASHIFLSHAAGLVGARGGRIVNADLTLLAEAPRIAPHAPAMQARIAEILGIPADRISVKATTMEHMGFVGREEGIGCLATATVALPAAS